MAGRPRKQYSSAQASHQTTRPRRRVDISMVPKAKRRLLEAYAACIQQLLAEAAATGDIPQASIDQAALEFVKAPYEVVDDILHFKAYHATHKDEAPANAFTPPRPGKKRSGKKVHSDEHVEQVSSDRVPKEAQDPKRRPDISTIKDPERGRIIAYAARIARALREKINNRGRMPEGERFAAATELGIKMDTLDDHVERLEQHLRDNPGDFPANAFTPLPRGRPKGRTPAKEITDAIEKAHIHTKWPTLNSNGTTSQINHPLTPALIHDLVTKTFPNATHSHWTTRRVINDYRGEHSDPAP